MKTLWRSSFLTLILVALDVILLSWIWLGSYNLRLELAQHFSRTINTAAPYRDALPLLLGFWLLILSHFRFYAHHERIADLNRLGPVFWATLWIGVSVALYNNVFKPDFGRSVILFFATFVFLYLYFSRSVFRYLKRKAVERGHGRVRVVVVGAGELGRETMSRLHEHPDIGFRVAGYLSCDEKEEREEIEGYPVLGRLENLIEVIQRHRVEEVFFAVPEMDEEIIFHWVDRLQEESEVVCKVVANMLLVIVNQAKVDEIIGLPVIAFRGTRLYPVQLLVKRMLDIVLCLIALPIAGPLIILFAVLIRLDSRGPAFFSHQRVGQRGKLFYLWKFRTMHANSAPYQEAPTDQTDSRITRFGAFLRRTSLDEIPQIWNVLRGEMSMIGPRPEMPFIVEKYSDWQKQRISVKPGVTGLWQVAGRKNLPLHFNLEYDYYYVKNQGLMLDLEILLRTVPAVLIGKGAY